MLKGVHMKIRHWIGCLCIVAMVFCLAGCAKEKKEDNTSSGSESTQENDSKDVDLTDAYQAYLSVIEENSEAIENYNWQREVSSDVKNIQRQVSLCDINGDGIPELFIMMAKSKYEATLHIYTYAEGAAKELSYTVDDSEAPLSDVEAGAGVNYVVYTGTDGNLYIYHTSGSESITYCLNTYDVDGTTLKQTTMLKNVYGPSEDDTDEISDVYYQDDKKMDSSKGKSSFKKAFKKMDDVIIYSGYDETSIWSRFDTDQAKCMSLDDLKKELQKGTDN